MALVGRTVDVDLTTACSCWTSPPGGTSAVVGTAAAGADVLRAATVSLARQHEPGQRPFPAGALVAAADQIADDCAAELRAPATR